MNITQVKDFINNISGDDKLDNSRLREILMLIGETQQLRLILQEILTDKNYLLEKFGEIRDS